MHAIAIVYLFFGRSLGVNRHLSRVLFRENKLVGVNRFTGCGKVKSLNTDGCLVD